MKMAATAWLAPLCPPNQMRMSEIDGDGDGDKEAGDRDGEQVDRGRRAERGEAVQAAP